jgi:signal transduction histidine kinase
VTARAYLRLLVGAGLAVLTVSLWLLARAGAEVGGGAAGWLVSALPLLTVGLLVCAAIAAQHFPFSPGTGHKVMLGGAVYYADVLLLGPVLAVPLVAASALLGQGLLALRRDPVSGRRRRGPAGIAFNTALPVLATAAGGAVYGLLLWGWPGAGGWSALVPGGAPPAQALGLLAAGAAAGTMYLVNSLAVATMVALSRGERLWTVWRAAGQQGRLTESAGEYLAGYFLAWALSREPWLLLPAVASVVVVARSLARREDMARREAQLARQEAEAEALRELARRKDEFLGTVSHELRTPLTVVCGYAELLLARDGGLDGEATKMMGSLLTSATQLSLMVDDMLDFARIERGVLACRPREVDLVPVVRLSLVTLRGLRGGEQVRADLPERFPAYADPERCGQIVNRLVANALQHAPGAPVTVRLYTPPEAPRWARLEVQDGGPGIPQEELVKVWEPFFRGQGAAIAEAPRGAGIGLALVKAIAEAQAGEAGVWSGAGRGSRFWVDLPVAPPGEQFRETTMGT